MSAPLPLCQEVGHDDGETPDAIALAPMYSGPGEIPWAHAAFCRPCLVEWRAINQQYGLPTAVLLLTPSEDF